MLTHPSSDSRDNRSDGAALALSVIVPAFNCPVVLQSCLTGLLASDLPRARWELIVVDDSSTDQTPDLARTMADRVLTTTSGPRGPGEARNLGATVARAGVLLFVDADVVVSPTTLTGFARAFDANPDVVAVFGAYDDRPAHPGFLSQYRNLLHHHVHSTHPGDASTFWAGCGAVRRTAFLDVGGFNGSRYPRPQIEDIELGYRLKDRGCRILLVPELQGKHLKQWTLRNMVRTDLRDRAVPWMHLLIDRREVSSHGPLNLQFREKALTAVSGIAALAFALAVVTLSGAWLVISLLGIAGVVLGNAALLRWFQRHRGAFFALRVVPFRLLFYVLSGIGAAWAILTHRSHAVPSSITPLHDRRDPVAAS
ncbi:MAG: glycosyltransferase family 2 protein [Gemmatimonadaceae bacterium]|nr:glycosyltransferase family 2 protein [Gemmatimonadaceae bacterium]